MSNKKIDELLKDETASSEDMDRLVFDDVKGNKKSRDNSRSVPRK
ncbi:MAG: hypothetical protein ACP5UV_03325 [Thermoplasmata archaeon]